MRTNAGPAHVAPGCLCPWSFRFLVARRIDETDPRNRRRGRLLIEPIVQAEPDGLDVVVDAVARGDRAGRSAGPI